MHIDQICFINEIVRIACVAESAWSKCGFVAAVMKQCCGGAAASQQSQGI